MGTSVKQPDESFFQAVILNSRFCVWHTDYTLHWTDKNSMREVRSDTSEYNILSPGVLHSGADIFKIAEVRKQALWARLRKFRASIATETAFSGSRRCGFIFAAAA